MIIRYLYIALFTCTLHFGSAQETYSQKNLEDFVQVYMTFKTEKKRNSIADKKHFDTFKVSKQRYHDISRAALTHQPLKLSLNEEKLMEALKKENESLNASNDLLLQQLCAENDLGHSTYISIRQEYQKNIQFQRSLKPYFDTYINNLK